MIIGRCELAAIRVCNKYLTYFFRFGLGFGNRVRQSSLAFLGKMGDRGVFPLAGCLMASTFVPETDFQRLVVEQALALAREVESTAGTAPHGKVLHQCEGLLLTRGREFLLQTLQAITQHTAD